MTTEPLRYRPDNYPAHPEQVPTTRLGGQITVGSDIEWWWRWRTCSGDYCSSDTDPGPVCIQPGVCIVHDPPDTVITW